MPTLNTDQLSPGVTVEVRDEEWLVTSVARSTDGFRIRVRGMSDYVRDTTATFYRAISELKAKDVCPPPVEHRRVNYLSNVREGDHGRLKRVLEGASKNRRSASGRSRGWRRCTH